MIQKLIITFFSQKVEKLAKSIHSALYTLEALHN